MTKENTTPKKNKKPKKRNTLRLIILAMWGTFTLIVASAALFFVLIANGVIGNMPDMENLENPIDMFASQVISADGELLFTYARERNNRIFVDFTELSPYLIDALIATEDIRFHNHSGIDIRGLGRAIVFTGILQRTSSGGGSTISQQLAKLLYSPHARNIVERVFHKLNEWVIAVKLERFYSKDEIINLYLNMYDFGNNAVGIESAARTYFNTTPGELNIQQSAMLIGMLQNSSRFNPNRFPERTKSRRNVVLSQMQRAGFITREEFDSLRQKPLDLEFRRMDHVDILAPYFGQELRRILMARKPDRRNFPHAWQNQQFIEDSIAWATNPLFGWAHKNLRDGRPRNIFTGGYRIFVTIDSRMQRYAEEAVTDHLRNTLQPAFNREQARNPNRPFARSVRDRVPQLLQTAMRQTDRFRVMHRSGISEDEILRHFNEDLVEMSVFSWEYGSIDTLMTPMDSIRHHKQFLRAGFMAMDPVTGHVKAYVGGPDFRFFQFDMVSAGKRQVGSITKPFVYALAMEDGLITACDEMFHEPIEFILGYGQPPWQPRSTRAAQNDFVTFQWGMDMSCNWVAAYLMGLMGQEASPLRLAQLLTSLGLRTAPDPVLSLALGPNDASVFEMVSAYSAFVNGGLRVEPILVTRIEDAMGQVLFTANPRHNEVFSERVSYQMVHMMQGAINTGTGGRLRRAPFNLHGQIAGKTGTSNDNADGWFMSFTPDLVVGAWVGGELPSIQFANLEWGQGGRMALPMHGAFFRSIFDNPDLPFNDDGVFPMPPGFDPCAGARRRNENAVVGNDAPQREEVRGIDNMFN